MDVLTTIERFDGYLAERGLRVDAVIIGGAALNLLGVVSRETKDIDVVEPEIPEDVKAASVAFAEAERAQGRDLMGNWFNNGPSLLKDQLPEGWRRRLESIYEGKSITLHSLGRLDLLRSKLFAYCDRQTDRDDCLALAPTRMELAQVQPWLEAQDANPFWPEYVRQDLGKLAELLEHSEEPRLSATELVARVIKLRRTAGVTPAS